MSGPRLRLLATPRLLAGAAWGVTQPVLLCSFTLHGAPEPGIEALQSVLETLVDDPYPQDDLPSDADAEGHADHALLRLLHRCCAAIQREQNVPAFGPCKVLPGTGEGEGEGEARGLVLAMPCPQPAALRAILPWVMGVANGETPGEDRGLDGSGSPVAGDPADRADRSASLQALRLQVRPFGSGGTNTLHFLAAAGALNIPVTRLAQETYQLGFGERSRWLSSSVTDRTPQIGVQIASRKDQTAALLRQCGLPVPQHRLVTSEAAAAKAAHSLGFPVVVKPADQEQGRGVFTRLCDDEQVRRSWRQAREHSKSILVECWHAGDDYRITVAHGRIVKVMHRRPGGVVGDGQRSVRELVLQVQEGREQQRAFRRSGAFRLALDGEADELLAEQGLQPDGVPAAGREVVLRRKANISAGGTHRLVDPAQVHADNLALAQRAAALLRLDLAGIDLISTDIAQPWHRNGAVICEVNARPQLGFRDLPQLYAELLREMVGSGQDVAFHALLVGHTEPSELARGWRAFAEQQGCNAWSDAQGAWLDGRQVGWAPKDSVASARTLLMERGLRAAFLVLRAEDVVQQGLPVDRLRTLGLLREPTAAAGPPQPMVTRALQMSLPHADRLVRYSEAGNRPRPTRSGPARSR